MKSQRVGIIGGGIVGAALGYNLSLYDHIDVTIFDKDQIGSGTTAKSAGTVCLFDDSVTHEYWPVRLYGFQTYCNMEKEEKGSAGFDNTGTLVIATDKEVEKEIKTGIALAKAAGYHGEYITDSDRILEIVPDLNTDNILGAGWSKDDGYFDATMISNTFVRKMKANGGHAMTYTKVEKINIKNSKVVGVKTNKGDFDLDIVVDASGPWTRFTGRMVDMEMPIWHTKGEVFFLVPPKKKLSYVFPVLKYPYFYARREGDNIFACKAHLTMDLNDPMHAGIWDPDTLPRTGGTDDYFLEYIFETLEKDIPGLLDSGVASSWLAYRAEPSDFMPIVGETPLDGYMLSVGYGGNGVIEAPTMGTDMAMYIATGKKTQLLEKFHLARFNNKS
ncbi:MAG: FAD-binding oxidoreductase [Desulfobacteraceae bacterium]|nr:FAD-binding oxidoreductase [Desulfobacteraceae bacterium]